MKKTRETLSAAIIVTAIMLTPNFGWAEPPTYPAGTAADAAAPGYDAANGITAWPAETAREPATPAAKTAEVATKHASRAAETVRTRALMQPGDNPARPRTATNNPATYASFGWDHGSQGGTSAHGFMGQVDTPMGEMPVRLFGGGTLHAKDGDTRLFMGAGPGVRAAVSETADVTAYVMLGLRKENKGIERNAFRARIGGSVDYQVGSTTAVHGGVAYDKAFHLVAGLTMQF